MPDGTNPGSDAPLDINAILTGGTSDSSETTEGAGGDSGNGQGAGESQQGYKFGGRSYADQKAAEAAHNKLYGKYSKSQEQINQLKEALTNPALFAKYSKDPEFAQILAKLGIQQAEEDLDREVEEERGSRGDVTLESLRDEIKVERAGIKLEREETRFERKLGRNLTDDEHDAIVDLIGQAPSLSFEQAYKLAFHDKLLKEAALKAGQKPGTPGNRPRPTPPGIPGVKMDLKKSITDMSKEEWRQNLRQSPELQNLLNP